MSKTQIHWSEIEIEDRQRTKEDWQHVKKLAVSIKRTILINAPVVQAVEGKCVLAAGWNRVHAIKELEKLGIGVKHDGHQYDPGMVPVTSYDDLTKEAAFEVELMENEMRLDLTWQDRDAALLKLKQMAEKVTGEDAKPAEKARVVEALKEGVAPDDKPQDKSAKKKTDRTRAKIQNAELRAQYANDPRVAKAKSASEADRIIKKDLEKKHQEKLAEQFKEKKSEHEIIFDDCTVAIKEQPDGKFDVIVSDPIYGIDAQGMHMFQTAKHKEQHHDYDDSLENWDKMFNIMPEELMRVAKDEAHCYLFCDVNRFFDFTVEDETGCRVMPGLATRMRRAGWTVWPRPLIWCKGTVGSIPRPDHGPRYTAEYVLYAIKGNKETIALKPDVFTIQHTPGKEHAAYKAPEVYAEVMSRSVRPGDRVLDFSAGSFNILPAANSMKAIVTAIELDTQYEPYAHLKKIKELGDD